MKKNLAAIFALALLAPSLASAASIKVTSPEAGEVFGLGETINISWSPAKKGVETIQMVAARPNGPALGIYGAKVLGDPVNYSGSFSYTFPNFLVVPAGKYRIRLYPEGGGRPVESRPFVFVSETPESVGKTVKAKYKIGQVSKLAKRYAPGDPIRFTVDALETKDVAATPGNGFNVQAHLYDPSDMTAALQAKNATFDAAAKKWGVEFVAPAEPQSYVAIVSLYCGNLAEGSYCAQKYDDAQVTKRIKIKVK